MKLDVQKTRAFVEKAFPSAQSCLEEFIAIPNQSPAFDSAWNSNGLQDKVVDLMMDWVSKQGVAGASFEVVRAEGKTPLIFGVVEAFGGNKGGEATTTLMYGHFDKQPPMTEAWDEGLGPYTPVIRNGKLYGRGGADDGYAIFAAILALKAIQDQGQSHGRVCIMIEGSEESGSPDLPHYVNQLSDRLGDVRLVVCLDSGCGDYEHFWITTSLRGVAVGTLKVQVLNEGVHSGAASGVVPDSFRVARILLDRIEDAQTGQIKLPEFNAVISDETKAAASATATILGDTVWKEFPFHGTTRPMHTDNTELLLNKTWRPTLTVTGVRGAPDVAVAGNVVRVETQLRLSVRLPPTIEAGRAEAALKAELERDPPFGAAVSFASNSAPGWEAPALDAKLSGAMETAASAFFDGKRMMRIGEGGSIPFMGMLGRKFPKAQFCVTGLLGPGSNAHGPNEFIHLDMAKRLIGTVAHIVQQQ